MLLSESEYEKRHALNTQAFARLSPEDKKEFVGWAKNMHAHIGHGAGMDTCGEIGWAIIRLVAAKVGESVDEELPKGEGEG